MLRERLGDALKAAMKAKDALGVATLRLVLARLKEADIEARTRGRGAIDEAQIQHMLHAMIKQRRDAVALYEAGRRQDLAARERGEIAIIERFLPQQLSDREAEDAIAAIIAAAGARSPKDMGKVMAAVREQLPGRIDTGRASGLVRKLLGAP